MRRIFTRTFSRVSAVAIAVCMVFALVNSVAYSQSDTTYLHLMKPKTGKSYFKSNLHLVLPPVKPAVISTQKISAYKPDDRLLSNVQVYPNPVTDQVNLKYDLSRYSNVTIKIVDVLGNDIITPFAQHVEPGEKTFSYAVGGKLTRGFYFIRIIAGTESVIKRISVL